MNTPAPAPSTESALSLLDCLRLARVPVTEVARLADVSPSHVQRALNGERHRRLRTRVVLAAKACLYEQAIAGLVAYLAPGPEADPTMQDGVVASRLRHVAERALRRAFAGPLEVPLSGLAEGHLPAGADANGTPRERASDGEAVLVGEEGRREEGGSR
jgi:hypothetical protein